MSAPTAVVEAPHITGRSGKHVYRKGEVVLLGKARVGVVKYVGPVEELNADLVYGIEIRMTEGTLGHCDGTIEGRRYFKCASDCGVFVRPQEVRRKISSHELLEKVVTLTKKCSSLRRLVKGGGSNSSVRNLSVTEQQQPAHSERPPEPRQGGNRKNSRSHDVDLSMTTHTRSFSTPVAFPWEEKLEPEFPSTSNLSLQDSRRHDAIRTISMWSRTRVLSWFYTFAPKNSSVSVRHSAGSRPPTNRIPSFDNYDSRVRDAIPTGVQDDNLLDEWQEVFDIFEEHGVNGRKLLSLDTGKLNSMGIVDATICWKILHEIDKLCDSMPTQSRQHDNDDSKMFTRMREFFRSLDEDGDGCIRISAWRTIVYENAPFRYQQMLTETLIHQVFNEFNITKSGSLSEDEFVIALGVFYLHRKRRRSSNNKFNQSVLQKDSPKIVFLYALKHILRKICGAVAPRNHPAATAGSPPMASSPHSYEPSFMSLTNHSSASLTGAGSITPSPNSYHSENQFRFQDNDPREGMGYSNHLDDGPQTTSSRHAPSRFLTRSLPLGGSATPSPSDEYHPPTSRHMSEPGAASRRNYGRSKSTSIVISERPSGEFNIPAQPSPGSNPQYLHGRISSTGSIKTGTV